MYFMRSLFGSSVILLTYYPLCLLFSYLFLKSRKRKSLPLSGPQKWALGLLFLVVIPLSLRIYFDPASCVKRTWSKIYDGRYVEAREDLADLFPDIQSPDCPYYQDYLFVKACHDYEEGRYEDAFFLINQLDASHFKGRLGDFFEIQQLRIRSMHSLRQSWQSEKASETEATVPDAPYVGMHESMISRTSLGQPNDNVRHNTEMVSGQVQYANLYDFTEDGRCIFTARCLNNKVIQIWDYRDQPRLKPRGEVSSSRNDFRIEDFTEVLRRDKSPL